jgi:hypothetical protein
MQRKDADGVVKDHADHGKDFQLFVIHDVLLLSGSSRFQEEYTGRFLQTARQNS